MKVAVFGNFGVRNLGDDLILKGFQQQLGISNEQMLVFCGNPTLLEQETPYRAFPFFPGGIRSRFKKITSAAYQHQLEQAFDELMSVERIYIGGGGILVDRHLKAVLLWHAQLTMIKKTGISYEFISNSLELNSLWSQKLFTPFLKESARVSVRDSASQAFLLSHGIQAELVQDLAYAVKLPDIDQRHDTPTICLALCRWGMDDPQKKALRSFVAAKQSEGFSIVGLAFQTVGDDDRMFYKELGITIPVFDDPENIIKQLSRSHFLVGMRFHSLVLADRFHIPAIAIAYQAKVTHFMKDQEQEEFCVSVENLDEQKLQALFKKAFAG